MSKYFNKPQIIKDTDFSNAKMYTFPVRKTIQKKLINKYDDQRLNTEIFKDTSYHTYMDTDDGYFDGTNLVVISAPAINPNYRKRDGGFVVAVFDDSLLFDDDNVVPVEDVESYELDVVFPFVLGEASCVFEEFLKELDDVWFILFIFFINLNQNIYIIVKQIL